MKLLSTLILKTSFLSLFSNHIPQKDDRCDRERFIMQFIKPGDIGCEIGVDRGVFSYHVLMKAQPSKLFLIDPWIYGLQPGIENEFNSENINAKNTDYENVSNAFAIYPNVEIIRMKSEDAVFMFPDNYFDYIYIDGEHSYAAVTRDLNNYFPKLKKGGYIIGDDYGWTGIPEAVKDFLRTHRRSAKFGPNPYEGQTGGQFLIKKIS